jgi:hypothetical protein
MLDAVVADVELYVISPQRVVQHLPDLGANVPLLRRQASVLTPMESLINLVLIAIMKG